MKHFFNDIKPVIPTTLENNKKNGKDAERYLASLLTGALNARISFGSRTEDDAKIDLITLFSHPWLEYDVQPIGTQAKSGASYCTVSNGKLVLQKGKFSPLLHKSNWILVCWTLVEEGTGYWFLVKPNSKFIKLEYNSNHIINPLTKYHLVRVMYSVSDKNGGRGLTFRRKNRLQDYEDHEYVMLRSIAKQKYAHFKQTDILNPVFGRIEFTRIGWRHITRESRWRYFKTASLEAIRILDKLLKVSPTKHYTLRHDSRDQGEFIYVENEFLLSYSEVKVFDSTTKTNEQVEVYIKLLEISAYRKDWKDSANKNNISFRRVIFKSIYYKQSSQNMHA